jgi:hypothetical protein
VSNAQLASNLANYITNTAAYGVFAQNTAIYSYAASNTYVTSTYQTMSGLASNVATLTANNANNFGGQVPSYYVSNTYMLGLNYVSNTQLASNLSNYITNTSAYGVFAQNTSVYNTFAQNTAIYAYAASNTAVYSTFQTMVGLSANVATLTANNTVYLNGQLSSYYTNATNITTGTLPYAQLPANVVVWSNTNTFTANQTFSANVNVVNVYSTGTVNASSFTVGTSYTVNSTYQLTTGQMRIANAGISAASWSTSGIGLIQSAATFTDNSTPASNTVPTAYMNLFAPQTYAATNTGVTVTNLYGTYFKAPTAGTNVTATSIYAIAADSMYSAGAFFVGGAIVTSTTTTLCTSISTVTANIAAGATTSGQTKTVNIGTAGLAGSTTNITLGSSVAGSVSNTTINGPHILNPVGTSAAAWSTNGIGLVQSAATFTDNTTAASGTVSSAYMNYFAPQTYAATNTGVTVTNLYGTYFAAPANGTNVTATNKYAIGADSILGTNSIATGAAGSLSVGIGGVTIGGGGFTYSGAATNFAVSALTSGLLTLGGTAGTGTITLGQSTVSQITNIQAGATASGNTKTVNIGTGGLSGSTTNITIGSSFGTNTTINGTTSFTGPVVINNVLQPGVVTINAASVSTITPVAGNTNHNNIYNINATPTINQPSGAPYADAQKLMLRLKDSGTANTLTWNVSVGSNSSTTAGFRPMATSNVALPSTTIAGKVTYVACVYNALDFYWDVVGVSNQ